MFNPNLVSEALDRVDAKPGLLYECKVARFDSSVKELFTVDLSSQGDGGSFGFIPPSMNRNWNFPVVQYPNGEPNHSDPCHVIFLREEKQHGEGKRNVVRIYKLRPKAGATIPRYRVTAKVVRNVFRARVILNTCRFAVAGTAENAGIGYKDDRYLGISDYAFIAIATDNELVKAIVQPTSADKQTEILF